MKKRAFKVSLSKTDGLVITWAPGNGLGRLAIPVRVGIRGSNTFWVWSVVDSGEGPPAWAEPELDLTFFGGEAESSRMSYTLETIQAGRAIAGYRAVGCCERAEVTLEFRFDGDAWRTSLSIANPQGNASRPLPLCLAELRFEDLYVGRGAVFQSAHPYGGRTHGYGEIADLQEPGVQFIHGCIGQGLPLVYLHNPRKTCGMEFEFMMDERPIAWLRPGRSPDSVHWCVTWSTECLLQPGQSHAYGGGLRTRTYIGQPVEEMRQWRDAAAERYGLVPPAAPEWIRRANIIELWMNPDHMQFPGKRLDDPRVREELAKWKEMGYNVIMAVGANRTGTHALSPFNYEPPEQTGGLEAERQMLRWAHEVGFRIFLWVTTVGIDRKAPEVREHPEWFTHRPNQELFYAWDSHAPDYVGYAPDADGLSTGWRQWLKDQVKGLIGRGYDGIFVDGCIPRASNHARWAWPGESRDSIAGQVVDLANFVRTLGQGVATIVEDECLTAQASCEMVCGRYVTMPPFLKAAYWDHGMGGGPEVEASRPPRIPPEMARDYLEVRYASLLPGVYSNETVEGYHSEAARPWVVQTLIAGMVFKTHSQYMTEPAKYMPFGELAEPPEREKDPAHRLRGYEEFVSLLKLCANEPELVRETPRSIEAVTVEGDDAVVGILRPTKKRALLAFIQFADRPAQVRVRLAEPVDIPKIERPMAGSPHEGPWRVREMMRSMVDATECAPGVVSAEKALEIALAPYGFRIFELTRESGWASP